jgi:hypothetical protein
MLLEGRHLDFAHPPGRYLESATLGERGFASATKLDLTSRKGVIDYLFKALFLDLWEAIEQAATVSRHG